MKTKQKSKCSITGSSSVTPFEKVDNDARVFITKAVFCDQFQQLLEDWSALKVLNEELSNGKDDPTGFLIAGGFVKKSFEEVDANVEMAIAEWNKHFQIEA